MSTQCVSNHAWSVQHQQKLPYYYPSNHKGSVRMAPLDEKSSRRVITIEYLGKRRKAVMLLPFTYCLIIQYYTLMLYIFQVCYGPNHLLYSCFLSRIKVILPVKWGSSSNWIYLWNTFFLFTPTGKLILSIFSDQKMIWPYTKKSKRVIRYE